MPTPCSPPTSATCGGKKNVREAERARLEGLLNKLLASYTPRAADLRQWADARGNGIDLATFWLPQGAVVGTDGAPMAGISRAYTRDAWDGVVQPMLATLRRQVPDRASRIDDLRDAYFHDYFSQWARFQARFGGGLGLWRGRYGDLLARAGARRTRTRFFSHPSSATCTSCRSTGRSLRVGPRPGRR
ncbi:ImcF-related family protein [Thermomonas sp. S9]|uniref:ImcF-related family protein n=1 Tax=Thermomonas sp. S9 TaxID=2885203 RepID=UPI00216B2416|nr:ImcF-related family protein [Thermomonas sp. S9]MCR6496623.1 ImcF-related family protein [Thermomonas sp. S9]